LTITICFASGVSYLHILLSKSLILNFLTVWLICLIFLIVLQLVGIFPLQAVLCTFFGGNCLDCNLFWGSWVGLSWVYTLPSRRQAWSSTGSQFVTSWQDES
jgi:hypothetical protein